VLGKRRDSVTEPLDLRRDEHGNYLRPSPYQLDRCVWPGCRQRRTPTEWEDDTLHLCARHAHFVTTFVTRHEKLTRRRLSTHDRRGEVHEGVDLDIGCIYFVRSGDKIKIGFTRSLERRLRSYPPDARVLATMVGTMQDEKGG
jgi:hypothetical protein